MTHSLKMTGLGPSGERVEKTYEIEAEAGTYEQSYGVCSFAVSALFRQILDPRHEDSRVVPLFVHDGDGKRVWARGLV